MGLLSWLFGGSDDSKSSQRGPFYYSRLENMEKIREARERWGKTQKELYRKGGTTALGLTTGSDGDSIDEDTDGGADEQEQEELIQVSLSIFGFGLIIFVLFIAPVFISKALYL